MRYLPRSWRGPPFLSIFLSRRLPAFSRSRCPLFLIARFALFIAIQGAVDGLVLPMYQLILYKLTSRRHPLAAGHQPDRDGCGRGLRLTTCSAAPPSTSRRGEEEEAAERERERGDVYLAADMDPFPLNISLAADMGCPLSLALAACFSSLAALHYS